jgi:hypothetical protein
MGDQQPVVAGVKSFHQEMAGFPATGEACQRRVFRVQDGNGDICYGPMSSCILQVAPNAAIALGKGWEGVQVYYDK